MGAWASRSVGSVEVTCVLHPGRELASVASRRNTSVVVLTWKDYKNRFCRRQYCPYFISDTVGSLHVSTRLKCCSVRNYCLPDGFERKKERKKEKENGRPSARTDIFNPSPILFLSVRRYITKNAAHFRRLLAQSDASRVALFMTSLFSRRRRGRRRRRR